MKNMWIILTLLGAFLVYRHWNQLEQLARTDQAPSKKSHQGGVVREWQQAPQAVMDMQGAIGGNAGNSPKTAMDAARGGLKTGRD